MEHTQRYEIFRKLPSKQGGVLVETAATVDEAKKRVKELTKMFPDDCFIFDIEGGCFIENEPGT